MNRSGSTFTFHHWISCQGNPSTQSLGAYSKTRISSCNPALHFMTTTTTTRSPLFKTSQLLSEAHATESPCRHPESEAYHPHLHHQSSDLAPSLLASMQTALLRLIRKTLLISIALPMSLQIAFPIVMLTTHKTLMDLQT